MRRLLPVLLAAAALAACRRPEGPAESYRAFAAAARAGDAAAVWGMLSERSRKALDARARALAGAAPTALASASGKDLVLGDLAPAAPRPRSVVVVRESRDAAVVAVEVDGAAPREVTLLREGGVWRVDVPFGN